MLSYFFSDEKIYFYESFLLLFFYTCYVIFMKFNERIEKWIKSKLHIKY